MVGVNLNIIMLLFQPSVVARGLAKRLAELGHNVTPIVGDVMNLDQYMDTTDIFIFNLPTMIVEYSDEIEALQVVCDRMIQKNKKMILVGERELHQELERIYHDVYRFGWVSRPVETQDLLNAIDMALFGTTAPDVDIKKRVLIVDDDPDYAKVVKSWIGDHYKVDIVTAGMQAISFLLKLPENETVNLILLDYEMPVVNGPQMLQMLRQDPATAHIPVVFLTGVDTRDAVAKVMALKPDGYILKSATKDELLNYLFKKLGQ
ncbi:response regulator [Butyrivibrio sp. XPD2006]|uniref:response regulator n=1 Tax=Butyrivibrio sp. XPD2006 TaxID=1280668 RepID=UPI0003B49E75|nr:response regulator [Butyrivibrio sp. XPD2006]